MKKALLGISTYHDDEQGKNAVKCGLCLRNRWMRVCHLGDLGHILTDEQIKKWPYGCSLLLRAAPTIDYEQAAELVSLMDPKLSSRAQTWL